jgi:hypothetical protein
LLSVEMNCSLTGVVRPIGQGAPLGRRRADADEDSRMEQTPPLITARTRRCPLSRSRAKLTNGADAAASTRRSTATAGALPRTCGMLLRACWSAGRRRPCTSSSPSTTDRFRRNNHGRSIIEHASPAHDDDDFRPA